MLYFLISKKSTVLLGGNSKWEPPDTIPNSVVKPLCADDCVRSPHAKVGHRQASKYQNPYHIISMMGFSFFKSFLPIFICMLHSGGGYTCDSTHSKKRSSDKMSFQTPITIADAIEDIESKSIFITRNSKRICLV